MLDLPSHCPARIELEEAFAMFRQPFPSKPAPLWKDVSIEMRGDGETPPSTLKAMQLVRPAHVSDADLEGMVGDFVEAAVESCATECGEGSCAIRTLAASLVLREAMAEGITRRRFA